jgi:hypothetical protein
MLESVVGFYDEMGGIFCSTTSILSKRDGGCWFFASKMKKVQQKGS